MSRPAFAVVMIAALATVCLAGCQATATAHSPRARAQSATAGWTKEAVAAVSSPTPKSSTKSDAYEACRTDHSYFTTTYQWRTITSISVPLAQQASATRAIRAAFAADGWTASHVTGLLTLTGPREAKGRGLVTVQTGGDSQLVVVAISACYS